LIELPAILAGVGWVRTGWILQGVTCVVVSIMWAVVSAWAVEWPRSMEPSARRTFTRSFLVALGLIGAVFGQVLGLFSSLAANYGADQVSLAIGFVQFFALGAAIAAIPSALIGGAAVLVARAVGRMRPATSTSQES
jgi:hypothetical protein